MWFSDIAHGSAGVYIEVNAGSYTLNDQLRGDSQHRASGISLTLADGEVATLTRRVIGL